MSALLSATDLNSTRDPIRSNQDTYRRTLDALATPGSLRQLEVHPAVQNLTEAAQWSSTLLLMLLDHEISLSVADFANSVELRDLLQRRTHVSCAPFSEADVVVTDAGHLTPELILSLRRGTLHYPDDSATLVVIVDDLNTSPNFRLEGPGIDGTIESPLPGFTKENLTARDDSIAQYPMGIDILILDGQGRLLGLPRTTSVTACAEKGA